MARGSAPLRCDPKRSLTRALFDAAADVPAVGGPAMRTGAVAARCLPLISMRRRALVTGAETARSIASECRPRSYYPQLFLREPLPLRRVRHPAAVARSLAHGGLQCGALADPSRAQDRRSACPDCAPLTIRPLLLGFLEADGRMSNREAAPRRRELPAHDTHTSGAGSDIRWISVRAHAASSTCLSWRRPPAAGLPCHREGRGPSARRADIESSRAARAERTT